MGKSKKVTLRKELCDPDKQRREVFVDDGEWVRELAALIEEDESKMAFVNETRVQQLKAVEEILIQIVQGREVRIEKRLHDPCPSMGYVSVIGKEIVIEDMRRFLKAAGVASNLDIYAKVDGTLQIDFTFHGLMTKGGIGR